MKNKNERDRELAERALHNISQIDKFFHGPDHDPEVGGWQGAEFLKLMTEFKHGSSEAETLLMDIEMYNQTITHLMDRHELNRCYTESVNFVKLLRKHVSDEYVPV